MKRALLMLVALVVLAGCTATYENQNGPRGPEKGGVAASWPWPLSGSQANPCGSCAR